MNQLVILLLTIFFSVTSCTVDQQRPTLLQQEIVDLNSQQSKVSPYVLAVGDKLAVKFFFNKALSDEVIVRPDGKISLQLIDDVQAAGLTTDELDSFLTKSYAKALKTSISKYTLAVGDQIQIKSYYNDKLDDAVTIRPDGKISLRLIDEVDAAGKTPSELDSIITEKYSQFVENPEFSVIASSFNQPELTVIIRDFSGQKIYIGGEVTRPGLQRITGSLQILDAIIQAAGPLDSGDLNHVLLIRRGEKNEPRVYDINIQNVLEASSPDIYLQSYDIVYVPKTAIASIDKFVNTYLWNLLPKQVMFSFLYNWNNEVQVETK